MNHSEIINVASKWLKKHKENIIIPNCSIVAKDLTTATSSGEIADVLGWCSWASVLIEVKTSRSDFLRDKKKPFRTFLELGMGDFKYYLCPDNLIKEMDLPDKWGLLYINEKKQIRIVKKAEKHLSNTICERTVLLSLIRRGLK